MSQFIEMFGNSPQKELGELATFVNGSAFKPEEWSQEGLPIVRIQNLTQGDAPYNYYSGDTSKKVCLNTGDILVSWSATLGVFTWSKGPALLNQHIFKVVFDKLDIEQSFFIYTVKLALEKMADKAHGSTMRHVVKKDFDSTKVSFPSMREQQRFVSIAEQADKSKFDDFKSQFIEMFENVESYCKLEDLISDTFPGEWGSEPISENAIKVIRTTNFTNEGYLDLTDVVTRDIEPKKVVRKKLKQGDTILERSGGTKDNPVGRVVFFDEIGDYLPNNFTQVLRPKESVNPVYLFYALYNSYNLNKAAMRAMASQTTGIQNLSMSDFMAKSIVLPSRDEQNKFEQIYRQADKSKFDDFKSQFIEMFGNPLSLNQKNELKRLGECCILNPRRPNIALCDTDKVSFIPMPAVSEDGYLVDMTGEEYGKVKKGFTYFENNDVLFAKITPCMENGKGAIVHGLTNGIGMGSTEFHVLRPINGISSPYWLLALTRMPIFRERAAKNMSGTGGQKRVSASYLDHFMVGLPAMEEQRRFEAIYRQADKSKSVIQKALVYLNDIQSDELRKIA